MSLRALQSARVLVTGASGLLGRTLVRKLAAAGAEVTALVRNPTGTALLPKGVVIAAADVRDQAALDRACRRAMVVIHTASMTDVQMSLSRPADCLEVNAGGALNIAEACRKAGVERLVHVSSAHVYAPGSPSPIDERAPIGGRSPYAVSKIAAEATLKAFEAAYGLPLTIARPFNFFGPGQSADALIPTIVHQALQRNGDIRLRSLTPVRDYCFVADIAEGLLEAAATADALGQTINLCSGRGHSVEEIARLVANDVQRRFGRLPSISSSSPPGGADDRLVGDATLAQALLGWTPSTSLQTGLTETIDAGLVEPWRVSAGST